MEPICYLVQIETKKSEHKIIKFNNKNLRSNKIDERKLREFLVTISITFLIMFGLRETIKKKVKKERKLHSIVWSERKIKEKEN